MSLAYPTVDGTATAEVTRVEIADHISTAFDSGPATRSDLAASATAAGARAAVITLLEQLPDRQYGQLRQLWEDLPEVPIGL